MSNGTQESSRLRVSYVTRLLIPLMIVIILVIRPTWLRIFISSVSPFFNISTAIATRTATVPFVAGLSILVICICWRRWFCRWLCPLGLACELCGHVRSGQTSLNAIPRIGRHLAAITIGGAIASIPFFLMIDPIVILFGAFGMSGTAGYIFLGILAVVIIASFILPGIWCRRICPLGGMQELLATPAIGIRRRTKEEAPNKKESAMARRSFLSLAAGIAGGFAIRWIISPVRRRLRPPGAVPGNRFKTLCVRCGNCVRVCPSRIIAQDSNSPDTIGILAPKVSFDSDYCRQDCNLCGQGCPSGAIKPLPLIEKNKRKIGLARIDEPSCRLAWDAKCDLCMYVCPCEAIEEVFNRDKYLYTISINPEKCNGCGHCKIICPEHAISMKPA